MWNHAIPFAAFCRTVGRVDEHAQTDELATYLVEGYRPGVTVEALRQAAERLRAAADEMSREGKPVRYVRSTIVPRDESCLFLVAAASEGLVRETYARAGVQFERISTAISVEEVDPERRGTL
jgi:hypothetical protein